MAETTHRTADDLLNGLDPEQREVAASPLGPMCVLAGAGTGKTRAITHRIAYGVTAGAYPPSGVLAVTFTSRAAGEMRTRLRDLGVFGVQARTFHAAALRQLHFFWPKAVGGPSPEILPHKAPMVAEAAARLRLSPDRAMVRDLAGEIEWAKVSGLTSETYASAALASRRETAGLDPTAMARVYASYEELKGARGLIDFEDVLLLTVGILADRDDIAAEVRRQYRHFVVDEYQDVNAVQERLLRLWTGDRDDVCVVGDPAQTIYSFTGATPAHLVGFTTRYAGARTVRLVRNYRSTPQVVELANTVLATGSSPSVRLQASRPAGPRPRLTAFPDDVAEAESVAAAISTLLTGGTPASEIAVLFRTNGQSPTVETALASRGIPYLVRGGERFFARDEVRRGILLLRGAARSDDGSTSLGGLTRAVLTGAGWVEKAPAGSAAREAWESLSAIASLADDLQAIQPEARLPDLIRELDERAASQHAPTVQGVTLASLHAAKGLEWDVVFLLGCSDGLLPISMADSPEAIEEERRLLYVGLTRARTDLRLSWAGSRHAGGRATRRPSRFLAGAASILGEGVGGVATAPAKAGARKPAVAARCRGCGADLATAAARKIGRCETCPPTYDEATFEALRGWRLEVAAAAKVPAYVVFTDATLIAIAEREPKDAGQLATISGVGPRKLALYGEDVLHLLARASNGPSATAD